MEKSQYEKEKDYFIDLWNKKADLTHLKSVLEDTDIKNIINSPRQLEQITSIEKLLQILSFRSEANIQTLYRIVSSAIRPFSNDLWLISFRDHISKCVFNNRYGDISSFSKPHKVHYGVNYIPLRNSECTKFSPESSPVLSEYEKLQPIHIGYLNLVYTTVGSNWLEFIRNLPEMKEWKINNFLDKYTDKNECFKHCLLEWGNKYPHKDRIKVVLQNTGMKCGIVIDLDN